MTGFRGASAFVGFIGQSLLLLPGPASNGYPTELMANTPTVPWYNWGIGGSAWSTLQARETIDGGCYEGANTAPISVLVMVGGTTSVTAGLDGAALYAAQKTMADGAHSAGYSHVIATTITPAASFTVGQEAARVAGNALVIANGDGAFDYVIGLGEDSAIAADIAAGDGVHWTSGANGAPRGADLTWDNALSLILAGL